MIETGRNDDLGEVFAEVLEVLKYLPHEDYDKIPEDVLNKLMCEANEKSTFRYNIGIPFSEQNLLPQAKQILADFRRRYFISVIGEKASQEKVPSHQ